LEAIALLRKGKQKIQEYDQSSAIILSSDRNPPLNRVAGAKFATPFAQSENMRGPDSYL
jgi:hypothetical protein